ncbi:MAG: phytanoyl-CoA dioxygenase family protein [Terrimicrobiaceae bacterium]|nr:phytanoyl-CoA dioxygenase family protein [Terrimicrobiaceae bacterium]
MTQAAPSTIEFEEPAVDLSFKPVDNPRPKRLSSGQIAEYNERGFLKPFDIFNPLEAGRNRAYFDYILAAMRSCNDGRDTYAINGYHTRCKGIYEMAVEPRILDLVEDIVGPNIIIWATHFFCKIPHDPKAVPWHQDASYWPLTPARTVTAWLAIDDVNVENSAMHVIPRTHNRGHLKWKITKGPAVLQQEIESVEQYDDPVPMELRAGQISLHADMTVHGSQPNRSARRRCGLTIRYCPPEVRPLDPLWAESSIIARGEDTHGWWANNAMPPGEDLTSRDKPRSIGGN